MQCQFCRQVVQSADGLCPHCHTPLGAVAGGDLRVTRWQRVMLKEEATAIVEGKETLVQPVRQKAEGGAIKFRPRLRPPMLVLYAWDDDGEEGRQTRIYTDRFAIGRTEGDLIFPHEASMSGKHLEIAREPADGRWLWKLRDLGSTNGTFVRVDACPLHHGQVLLIGSGRYRFMGVAQGGRQAVAQGDAPECLVTQKHQVLRREDICPMLVRLADEDDGDGMLLEAKEQYIGTDRSCKLCVPDDPLMDRRHARLHETGREQWAIQDMESTNGVWTMVHEVVIEDTLQFQVGEQRFLARVP